MAGTLWHLAHRRMNAAPGLFHQLVPSLIPWLHLQEYGHFQLAASHVLMKWQLNPQITLLSLMGQLGMLHSSSLSIYRKDSAIPYG